jgi:hypothetical protein
MFKKICSS